jgi:hypothetical protein
LPETDKKHNMGFKVLMVGTMKITVVWDVMPCGLADIYWHFMGKLEDSNLQLDQATLHK